MHDYMQWRRVKIDSWYKLTAGNDLNYLANLAYLV